MFTHRTAYLLSLQGNRLHPSEKIVLQFSHVNNISLFSASLTDGIINLTCAERPAVFNFKK